MDIKLFYSDPRRPITVQEFIQDRLIRLSPEDFLLFRSQQGPLNLELIVQAYTLDDWRELNAATFQSETWVSDFEEAVQQYKNSENQTRSERLNRILANLNDIRGPVTLFAPAAQVSREIVASSGRLVVGTTSYRSFLGEQIDAIIRDPLYRQPSVDPTVKPGGSAKPGTLTRYAPAVSVWAWCKALGAPNSEEVGGFIDLTPFIQSASVNVGANGGNFSIDLPFLTANYDSKAGWVVRKEAFQSYKDQSNYRFADSALRYLDNDPSKVFENVFLFHHILQANDLLFIKFERLELEGQNDRVLDRIVTANDLPGQLFDMIGLVDQNSQAVNASGNDVSIRISGRDLVKAIIDDGTYFFPLEAPFNYGSPTGMFKFQTTEQLGRSVERVFGSLQYLSAYTDRTIEFSLQFIINALSNIQVAPDDVFSAFPDKSTRYQELGLILPTEGSQGEGLRRNFNTTGPAPLDQSDLLGVRSALQNAGRGLTEQTLPGIWGITRLVVDPEISGLRVVDSSIATQSGSIINFVRKVAQEPFVEFFCDTYGDRYYWIVRRPPFTREAIKTNYCVSIPASSVQSVSLAYATEAYSWYQLIPEGNYSGRGQQVAIYDFPAIFFPEYAEIYGSKPLQVVSNYIDYLGYIRSTSSRADKDLQYLREQSIRDLRYMIETNAYLPFTRQGTITFQGDRRIKRGMTVYLESTGELFYVDGVQNNFSKSNTVNRETVVQVSRGMQVGLGRTVEQGVIDLENSRTFSLYFDVIDYRTTRSNGTEIPAYRVRRDVFRALLRRTAWGQRVQDLPPRRINQNNRAIRNLGGDGQFA